MAKYPAMTTTNAGLNVIGEANTTGVAVIFTKIVAGDGDVPEGTSIADLTSVISPHLEIATVHGESLGNGQYQLKGTLDNSTLETGFRAKEIGVYAKAGEDGEENLFAYTNGGNYTDYIPDKRTPIDAQDFYIDIVVGNANEVEIIVSDENYVTREDVDILITQYAQELAGKVDKVTFNDLFRDTAAAHNCLYRGKDLTEYWESGEMSAAIADGSFRDIYPGDYIIKTITINGTTYNNVKFIVMDLDYFQPWSFDGTDKHHIVMMPEGALGTQYMNSTNITTGGYVGSYMHTTHIPKVNAGIVAAFGSAHVLSHQEYLTNAVDTTKPSGAGSGYTGCATNWTAVSNLKCCLCSENMVYGGRVWGSAMDTGCASKQLAAFRHNQQLRKTTSFWLRAVSYSATFAYAHGAGGANSDGASAARGVRPYFPLA